MKLIIQGLRESYLITQGYGTVYTPSPIPDIGWDHPFPLGFFGNKAVLLYNPSVAEHPSVDIGDALADNLMYCNTWGLMPKQQAVSEDGMITGHPDRNVFTPGPIELSGEISQKMLARDDGSPDYVMIRLYEHCRHAWQGLSSAYDGGGVQGITAGPYNPQFSFFTDLFGIFSNCQVDSVELIAEANKQAEIKYQVVALKQWSDDAPAVRNLLTTIGTSENANMPMRQIFSTDCGITIGDAGDTVDSPFDMPAGGTSELMKGYHFGDAIPTTHLVRMSFKIENFMKPNYTMKSRESWETRELRNTFAFNRFKDNIWPRSYYTSKQRKISGQLTWITDAFPFEIFQRLVGTASNQMYNPSNNIGESLLFFFGPMVIKIVDPIWSVPEPRLIPDDLFMVTANLESATDGPLILQPTEDWTTEEAT